MRRECPDLTEHSATIFRYILTLISFTFRLSSVRPFFNHRHRSPHDRRRCLSALKSIRSRESRAASRWALANSKLEYQPTLTTFFSLFWPLNWNQVNDDDCGERPSHSSVLKLFYLLRSFIHSQAIRQLDRKRRRKINTNFLYSWKNAHKTQQQQQRQRTSIRQVTATDMSRRVDRYH